MENISPKEKAKELIFKMWGDMPNRNFDKTRELVEENYLGINDAISSAIICVEEILEELFRDEIVSLDAGHEQRVDFWENVKRELNAL